MIRKTFLMLMAVVALNFPGAFPSMAQDPQIRTSFVRLGPGAAGVLYEPAVAGEKSQIAIIAMHSDRDYMDFSACRELAGRGYRVLGANSLVLKLRFGGFIGMDGLVSHVGMAVDYLRSCPGVRKVVLLGHSGGGALMSAYQNIAENGVSACQGPEKIVQCPDRLAGLPPADGVMLIDSNWGLAAMMLFALDPAVVSEADGQPLNPALDMYNSANGFDPKETKYSDAFIQKFLSAEGKRNNRLIEIALNRMQAIGAGKGAYADDEPFNVPGGSQSAMNNKLYVQDLRLMSRTRKAWPLLRPDGSIVTQVIHSVRVPQTSTSQTASLAEGALMSTVREFLSTFAVRVTDDFRYGEDFVQGIDWSSSYSCPPGNVEGITAPMLVMGMTGGYEFLAAETIYENAKSADKTLVFVEGAGHTYDTCRQCEEDPGQFGNTKKTTYDYIDKWLSQKKRFMGWNGK